MNEQKKGISKTGLIALVISSSLGSGIFGLTGDLAKQAAPGPAIFAWIIVSLGILMLVLSLNYLANKRPDLDGGMFSYAEETFGRLGGFISGWGYWLCSWLGNVAFATIIMSAIGHFFPIFDGGQNIPSILFGSILIWTLTLLVSKGVESASFVNIVITICKLVPLFVFIIIMIISFKVGVFTESFFGQLSENLSTHSSLTVNVMLQIKNSIMILMWVFVGIEGASMLANRAQKRSDAQQATIIGLIGLICIYLFASILPYGVFTQDQLAQIEQPAVAHMMKLIVGNWGANLINIGLIVSILGSWISWTMLPAETTFLMARDGLLPKKFSKLNKNNAPSYSLFFTAALTNSFLLTFLVTDYAYKLAYSLATAAILICYLMVSIYQIQFAYAQGNKKQLTIGIIATLFQLIVITLAGLSYVLMCSISYIPGFYFYYKARKENGYTITSREKIAMTVISSIALLAIFLLITGAIHF
ncbi:arginine-ornithine antiporter [Atopobacter phocae]|uniref:arginine-ornithine antiporter n=1 Tax=Atopobacter phocae TaxID=136492 RepID=UPI0004718FCB|nr:arginine-ornithine antiporter [Atopobacter phocae]